MSIFTKFPEFDSKRDFFVWFFESPAQIPSDPTTITVHSFDASPVTIHLSSANAAYITPRTRYLGRFELHPTIPNAYECSYIIPLQKTSQRMCELVAELSVHAPEVLKGCSA